MRHEILLILYIVLLAAQIFSLVKICRREGIKNRILLMAFEVGSTVLAITVMGYYNEHPGYMMSTLGHVLWSMGAAVCYGIMTAVTGIIFLIQSLRKRK